MDKDEAHKQEPVRAWFTADEFVEMAERRTKEWAKQKQGEPVAYAEQSTLDWLSSGARGPVAYVTTTLSKRRDGEARAPLYTTPKQRTWVGLTDEERHEIMKLNYARTEWLVHATEAKLKEKNT
jgi:hypothetical protein